MYEYHVTTWAPRVTPDVEPPEDSEGQGLALRDWGFAALGLKGFEW